MKTTLATLLLATATGACVSSVGATNDRPRRDPAACVGDEDRLGTTTIRTQADVDDLPTRCFSIDGDLVIERSPLTDLTPLKELGYVDGDLRIVDNTKLASLSGIVDVEVRGAILVEDNLALADLDGLEITDRVTALTIRNNDRLTSLGGLRALEVIDGDLVVDHNPLLRDLGGLDHVTEVRRLEVADNDNLTSLAALSDLSAATTVAIRGNDRLARLDGMTRLDRADELIIHDNPQLTSLAGLAITQVTGSVDIHNNGLQRLGLAVTSVGRDFILDGNPALTGVDGLAPSLIVGGAMTVTNNPQLQSVLGLYVGTRAANLVVMGNTQLSRWRADHLQNHASQFPNRTILSNGSSNSPDYENH